MDTTYDVKETITSSLDSDIRAKKRRKIEQISISEAYQPDKCSTTVKKTKDNPKKRKKSYEINYEQPFGQANMNLCEKTGLKLKHNQIGKQSVKIKPTIFEQQPKKFTKTTDEERMQNSYERTVEESRAARQSAQNLLFREQEMEKKKVEDQLIKVTTISISNQFSRIIFFRILKI